MLKCRLLQIKEIEEKEAQHTNSGTCTKDPSAIFSTCVACQKIKSEKTKSHPGFIIAFDNIDIHQERRQMTMSAQNTDIHWVNHEMVQNRVSGNNFDSENPKANLENVPNKSFRHFSLM